MITECTKCGGWEFDIEEGCDRFGETEGAYAICVNCGEEYDIED